MPVQLGFMCTNGGCFGLELMMFVGLPLAIIVGLTAVGYLLLKVTKRTKNSAKANLKLASKVFMISTALVVSAALLFIVIPTMIQDDRWERKQADCARQIGYSSPADDDNPDIATADSQVAYRRCLDID